MAAGVCLVAAGLGSACLTNPPPDLTNPSSLGPEIVGSSLIPQEGLLNYWPSDNEFIVPVHNVDPSSCYYVMFAASATYVLCQPCQGFVDGEVFVMDLSHLMNPFSPDICDQVLTFSIATKFLDNECTRFDPTQGDSVQWQYSPPTCFQYDAGAAEDGAFPGDR